MILNWFLSRTVRQAGDLHKHVRKLLNSQRDILSGTAVTALEESLATLRKGLDYKAADEALQRQMTGLEGVANKWLKPYPNAGIRENVEVLLVALAVAMGIRTFILQPFKIPTGSMQPTLFGVTSTNLKDRANFKMPGPLMRIYDACVLGTFYHQATAEDDGEIVSIGRPEHLLKFFNKQSIYVRYQGREAVAVNFWFTPDDSFAERAGIEPGDTFRKGDDIVKFEETAGDHLFVDRLSYNFRHPTRGEIIVFETRGIDSLPQDQFYIKRLVALGGERVQIGADRHLVIDGKRLDATTPHFENVYSFNPATPAMQSHFSGHVNNPNLAPLFVDRPEGFLVRSNHFMVMGDNTMNSYDSRAWGDFPETNVIGKYFLVYWPFSARFGWNLR